MLELVHFRMLHNKASHLRNTERARCVRAAPGVNAAKGLLVPRLGPRGVPVKTLYAQVRALTLAPGKHSMPRLGL